VKVGSRSRDESFVAISKGYINSLPLWCFSLLTKPTNMSKLHRHSIISNTEAPDLLDISHFTYKLEFTVASKNPKLTSILGYISFKPTITRNHVPPYSPIGGDSHGIRNGNGAPNGQEDEMRAMAEMEHMRRRGTAGGRPLRLRRGAHVSNPDGTGIVDPFDAVVTGQCKSTKVTYGN
jgi:hypothetical protein